MDAGIQLVVRSMIARYGDRAAANAARRARVLQACGERETSQSWDLVCERIEDVGRSSPRRGGYFSDDDPDPVAAMREAAFGDGVLRTAPDVDGENDIDEDPSDPGDEAEPSFLAYRGFNM